MKTTNSLKDLLLCRLDFSEQDYIDRFGNEEGITPFDEFIDNVVRIVQDNDGDIEDAVFIANEAYSMQ